MSKILWAICLATTCIFSAEAQKGKASAIKKTCLSASCCNDNSKSALTGMDAFATQAATESFAALHEAPLEFTLENPKGTNITFATQDGKQGRGYEIKATQPTNNYLIVIQEWWGLNDHIRQESENYYTALEGKVNVLAVDLYDGKVAATPDSAKSLVIAAMQSNRKEIILTGALAYAGSNANIYTIGWCFGGMMSLQTGILAGKQGKGTVMYYGQPETDDAKLKNLSADVLGIFGTQDKSIPNETVDQFAVKMKSLGKSFQLERYDAPHAFANPSNPSYNATARDDAFKKSVAFLKARIK